MRRLTSMQDERGATAIEFAIVAPVFFLLLFGIIEYGLIMLTRVAIEAATVQAGRSESLGNVGAGCADRVCEIKRAVAEKTQGLIDPQSVFINAVVVSTPTTQTPPVPDICLDDVNNPFPPTGACSVWQNNDGLAGYQKTGDLSAGAIGAGSDMVEIRVTYLWRVLFPLFRSHFGNNGVLTITASTVVKNEPF